MALDPGVAEQVEVGIVAEATFGTTPLTPSLVAIPHSGIDMSPFTEKISDPTIAASRIQKALRLGFRGGQGSLPFALRYGDYDPFWEMLMGKAWNADVLTTGSTLISKTLEIAHRDISLAQQFIGTVVSNASLNIAADGQSPITGSFGLISKDFASDATLDAAYTAASSNEPMTAGEASVEIDASTAAYFNSISLNIEPTIGTPRVIGSKTAPIYTLGKMIVSGSIVFYVEDDTWLDKHKAETVTALSVVCADPAGNSLEFELPKFKVTGISLDRSGDAIRATGQIEAFDPAQAVDLRITRAAA